MSEQGEQQWHYSTALQQKTSLNWCFSSSPNRKIVCNQTTSHALSINFLFVWHIRCASADRNSRVLISILKHKSMNQGLCILSQGRRNRGQFSPYPPPPTPDFGWNRSENCDMPIYVWRNNMHMIQSYKIKGLCMQDVEVLKSSNERLTFLQNLSKID